MRHAPPAPAVPPTPPRRSPASGLFGCAVVAGGAALSLSPRLGWAVWGGMAILGASIAAGRAAARRRAGRAGDETVHPRRGRRVVGWLVGGAAVAGLVAAKPVLVVGVLAVVAAFIFRALHRLRRPERTDDVNPPPTPRPEDEVGERWDEFTRRAGLRHKVDRDLTAQLIRNPAPNGVGGTVVRVGLREAELLPEDLKEVAEQWRRILRYDHVFVRPLNTDAADVHLYRGRPLAQRVPYQWLADHQPADRERVAVGATVTAEPATVRWRHSILWGGLTSSGKTSVQLALVHAVTAVHHIPVHLLVLDNRGGEQGGSELRPLDGLPGVVYRNRTVDAWTLVCRALDIMAARQAAKGSMAELVPDDRTPLVRLWITELVDVLDSRPPTDVADWERYSRGRFDRRPKVEDWRAMLVEGLAEVVRKGRDVAVCLDAAAQAGQVSVIPGQLRYMIGQRGLFRVANASDAAPILGDAAGVDAHVIPDWQAGAGYLRGPDGRSLFFRAAHVADHEFEQAVVEPLREWGRGLLHVVRSPA
jgi:hypothetical protein